jgi:hypothetical protein
VRPKIPQHSPSVCTRKLISLAINAGHACDCDSSLVASAEHPYTHRELHDCLIYNFKSEPTSIYRRVNVVSIPSCRRNIDQADITSKM